MTFRFPGKMNDFVRKFIRGIFGEKKTRKMTVVKETEEFYLVF